MKYVFASIALVFGLYMLWERNWLCALGALSVAGLLVYTPKKDLKNLDNNYFPKEED